VSLSELMARSIESVDILLRALRDTVREGDLQDGAHARRLSELGRERILGVPPVRALVVFDEKGRMIALSRAHPPPKINVADRDYFIAQRGQAEDRLFIGVPTINRVNQEWTINLARRLTGADGSFAGVVLATLEPLYYERVYAAINLDPGSSIAMFRGDGVLLARHPHSEEMMGKAIGDTPFRRALGRSTAPVVVRAVGGIDQVRRILAGRFLADFPIYVGVTSREDAVLADWRQGVELTAAVMAAVLLALGALTVMLLQQARQREAAERRIVAASIRAESASQAKSAFLANMSHELRTPLNAIIGFAEILDSQMFGPLANDRQREYVRDIHASGEHLRDLVSDILDLAKIEAGKWELEFQPCRLAQVFGEVEKIMHGLAEHAGVALSLCPPTDGAEVFADRLALRQMLINLLGNSIKFTPAGGQISMTAQRDGDASVIQVADNGPGINPQDIERVLEPFEMGDGMLRRPKQDTGLGLALTKALAEQHGGYLAIDSRPGGGTTIRITLPSAAGVRLNAPTAAKDPELAAARSGAFASETAL